MSLKLYVLIRDDIGEAQQAVQAGHALAKFGLDYPDEFFEWQNDSNTLIYLSVDDIYKWATILDDGDIAHSVFHEPDIKRRHRDWEGITYWRTVEGGLDTAIAVAPNWWCQYILFKDLPLALQPKQKPDPKKWWKPWG